MSYEKSGWSIHMHGREEAEISAQLRKAAARVQWSVLAGCLAWNQLCCWRSLSQLAVKV